MIISKFSSFFSQAIADVGKFFDSLLKILSGQISSPKSLKQDKLLDQKQINIIQVRRLCLVLLAYVQCVPLVAGCDLHSPMGQSGLKGQFSEVTLGSSFAIRSVAFGVSNSLPPPIEKQKSRADKSRNDRSGSTSHNNNILGVQVRDDDWFWHCVAWYFVVPLGCAILLGLAWYGVDTFRMAQKERRILQSLANV